MVNPIFQLAGLKANIMERALLLALGEHSEGEGLTVPKLASMLGTSDRQIRRLLRSCEAKGLLQVQHRPGQSNTYALHPILRQGGRSVTPDAPSSPAPTPTEKAAPVATPDTQSPRTTRPPKAAGQAPTGPASDEKPARTDRPPVGLSAAELAARVDALRAARESDHEFAMWQQFQARLSQTMPSRAVRLVLFALQGGELAMARLGVDWSATSDTLRRAYREACRSAHPDRGGSQADFVALTEAYERVRAFLEDSR